MNVTPHFFTASANDSVFRVTHFQKVDDVTYLKHDYGFEQVDIPFDAIVKLSDVIQELHNRHGELYTNFRFDLDDPEFVNMVTDLDRKTLRSKIQSTVTTALTP